MIKLSGYEYATLIYESDNSLVYRAKTAVSQQPVIIKILKQPFPSPEKIARFQQEFTLTKQLASQWVIPVQTFEQIEGHPAIIFTDVQGLSLSQWLQENGTPTLEQFLIIASDMAKAMQHVHQQNVMHKDINISNVIYQPETATIQLIDFGIATQLSKESKSFLPPQTLEGTLAYISPEQTGRMNRPVDYRTDLYSLGVTFYEMLTGRLPHDEEDPLALIHAHIAKVPIPPHKINSQIPEPISEIIMTLLAKNAEDRYQSAHGLHADLSHCLHAWQKEGEIVPFPLQQQDLSNRFHIPQKLYGRTQELNQLLQQFEQVCGGSKALILLKGQAGIGKSALVRELYRPITSQKAFFISGKFEQFQRNVPYAPVLQAFQGLLRQLLTEDEPVLASWRKRLLTAVGETGQLLIDVLPELERIIGKQPPVVAVQPSEAQTRFNLLFARFVQCFAQAEHPLVLFLDDMQWADQASLQLLQHVLLSADTHHLLLLTAYRGEEVDATHPFMTSVKTLQEGGLPISRQTLKPLEAMHVYQLISDTLKKTREDVAELAQLVMQKTGGNPFFINAFLQMLYDEKLLTFTFEKGGWHWRLQQIEQKEITDNVVTLMMDKVQKLDETSQQALKLAACIGSQFDLHTLSLVLGVPSHQTAVTLWPPLEQNLITPLSDAYQLAMSEVEGLSESLTVEYRFIHDRVQQSAYELLSEAEKQATHQKIGRLLLEKLSAEEQEQNLFDIAHHLNRAQMTDLAQQLDLAYLNLKVGQKAKSASAYAPAYEYLSTGLALLPDDSWQTEYPLTLALHTETAEAAYLSGNFEVMEQLKEAILANGRSTLDTIPIYQVIIQGYVAQNQPVKSVETALAILKELGVELSADADASQAISHTKSLWEGQNIRDLINLPDLQDPEKQAAIEIMGSTFAPVLMSSPGLIVPLVTEMVNLSIQHGNAPVSAFAYAIYGSVILCGGGDQLNGYEFGQLALDILDKYHVIEYKSRTYCMVFSYVVHWKEHLKQSVPPLLESFQNGLESGEIEYGSYSACMYCYHPLLTGAQLSNLEAEMGQYVDAVGKLKVERAVKLITMWRQVAQNLLGMAEDPIHLIGESYDETSDLPPTIEAQDGSALHNIYLNKMMLAYLFGDYQEAEAMLAETSKYTASVIGLAEFPMYHFYQSLVQVASYDRQSADEQAATLATLAQNQSKLSSWAEHAPMNYAHKHQLLEAERLRVLGEPSQEAYDQAIALALEHEYINEAGLAQERAAIAFLDEGQTDTAKQYLQQAYRSYATWGAKAKTVDLAQKYPTFIAKSASSKIAPRMTTTTTFSRTVSTTTTTTNQANVFDLHSVLKAAQAISGEIVLDKLLDQLLRIVMENAGAERGLLILHEDGRFVIEAEASIDNNTITVMQAEPVLGSKKLPLTVFRYVTRLQQSVVLSDATQMGEFTSDPYIQSGQIKSLLCQPLLNRGQLSGILYLENNLIANAFTDERIELLNLLSAQAAVSIDNARLYATLEDKVDERTKELRQTLETLQATQTQLVESEKMAALGNLVAGVAHEINTPIGVGITAASVLEQRTQGLLRAYKAGQMKRSELIKYLDTAEQSTHMILTNLNRAAELIQSFKQVAVDQSTEEKRPFFLKAYLEDILRSLNPRLKQTQLVVTIDGDDMVEIDSYPGAWAQIVTNLIMNSVIHAYDEPKQGQLTLRFRQQEQTLIFQYADDGKGIPLTYLKHIFDPFFTTKRGEGGSGLGMHIVYNLVNQQLGGSIQVESHEGQGTSFRIEIPMTA